MQLEPVVLTALATARMNQDMLILTCSYMGQAAYGQLKESMVRIGGKPAGGNPDAKFRFPYDPRPLVANILNSGEMPPNNPTAFFPTPSDVIAEMIEAADLPYRRWSEEEPMQILEPSAGHGAIMEAVHNYFSKTSLKFQLHGVEYLELNAGVARKKGFDIWTGDFIEYKPDTQFDVVLMNPPFSLEWDATAYISHTRCAFNKLRDGGVLVGVAPTGFTRNMSKRETDFLKFVLRNGEYYELGANRFKESGTAISTVLIRLVKESQDWRNQEVNGFPNWDTFTFWSTVENNNSSYQAKIRLYDGIIAGRYGEARDWLGMYTVAVEKAVSQYIEQQLIYCWQEAKVGVDLNQKDLRYMVERFLKDLEEYEGAR